MPELSVPVVCEPWGPDCGAVAVERWWAMCCGRWLTFCAEHCNAAVDELRRAPGMYCLVCGEDYGPGTWVRMPV